MTRTYLTFFLYGELYAIQVDKVLEVLEKQELTKVPNAPEVIKGVLNFRGNVVPIYDTYLVLKLAKVEDDFNYFIIIFELNSETSTFHVGAIVDKVREVIAISDDEIKSVPSMNTEYNSDVISGIIKYKDDFIMIMDVNKVFSSQEMKSAKEIN